MQSHPSATIDTLLRYSHGQGAQSVIRDGASSLEQTTTHASSAIAQSGASKRPLPALPVEVIEKILKYTFLPKTPLTPSSDPFHLRGTTHVLLISRGVRQLALPFFLHTVSITRPSHYITFFDRTRGLFTAGEEGRARWALVHELGILAGIQPIATTAVDASATKAGTDCPEMPLLDFPQGHKLDVVCFLHSRQRLFDYELDPAAKGIVSRWQPKPILRENIIRGIAREVASSSHLSNLPEDLSHAELAVHARARYGRDLEAEVDLRIRNDAQSTVLPQLREALAVETMRGLCPIEPRWSYGSDPTACFGDWDVGDDAPLLDTTLVVYPSPPGTDASPLETQARWEEEPDFVRRIRSIADTLDVSGVRLEGFSRKLLTRAKENLAQMVLARTWTFVVEDGSEVVIPSDIRPLA